MLRVDTVTVKFRFLVLTWLVIGMCILLRATVDACDVVVFTPCLGGVVESLAVLFGILR